MLLSGWCRIQAATPWRNRGMPDIPRSAVGKLANFCDVSSSHELRTNPPVIDGSAKSWNAGGVATSPEGRCAGSYAWRAWRGATPRPKAHHDRACRSGRASQPDRKGGFAADAPVPETGGRPSPICFSSGKDSCTRQAVTGPWCHGVEATSRRSYASRGVSHPRAALGRPPKLFGDGACGSAGVW